MWKLLESIFNSFLLLRDIFGYLIPGAVFVFVLEGEYLFFEPSVARSVPSWLVVVILIAFCYVAGQVLVGLGFTAYTVLDKILGRNPLTAADADLIYYRYVYPSMLIERDRRDIINIMRVGLGVGLTLAAWFFPFPLRTVILAAGLFALANGYTGRNYVFKYGVSTVQAAQKAEQNHIPYFRWNEHSDKGNSDDEKAGEKDRGSSK